MSHVQNRPSWPYCDSNVPKATAEKDSCGVGFLAQIDGKTSNWLLKQALKGLCCMEHRGGCGGDSDSGDGAGLLCGIPWNFLSNIWPEIKNSNNSYGLGMIFMPKNEVLRKEAQKFCEHEANRIGLISKGWRDVPVNELCLGELAKKTAPFIQQWLIEKKESLSNNEFEAVLFRLRRRIGKVARDAWGDTKTDLYIASLSSRTVVYKGMVRSSILPKFYEDLQDPKFEIAFGVYHRRFSTNTLPRWPLAQPMRLLGHNGEINTLLGNLNWAKATEVNLEGIWGENAEDIKPVVNDNFSDSANLDATLELLVRSGRPITDSLLTLVPEAFRNQPALNKEPEIKAFYEYSSCVQEPWDGPALLVFSDGRYIGANLDRNGLRPARYCITNDGVVVMGSEAGVVELDENRIIEKGRLGPGQMLAVDLENGRLLRNWDVKKEVATRYPYKDWVNQYRQNISTNSWDSKTNFQDLELLKQQTAFGFTAEDFDLIIEAMASGGKEPTFCMGDDIPLAVLSDKPHLLYDYFKQRFAQVTNPPIDPLREKLVMSLEMNLGKRFSPLSIDPKAASVIHIESPVLNESSLQEIIQKSRSAEKIKTLFPIKEGVEGLKNAIQKLCKKSEEAVLSGAEVLLLSDRCVNSNFTYVPALLAVGAVHHHLLNKNLRLNTSIIIETGQCWSTHHLACLIGFGASAVCPWLTWETTKYWWNQPKTQKLIETGKINPLSITQAQSNLRKALEDGLRKILSKIGISMLSSYHGAQIFEAIGIGADLIDLAFKGTTSRIAGLSLQDIANETLMFHTKAFPEIDRTKLEFMGFVQYRNGGEFHLNSPEISKILHKAVRKGSDYDHFSTYKNLLENRPPTVLRDLLTLKKSTKAVEINEVETAEEICKRFCTGGMSLGALSREAHEVLAIAMNRIGGKSNSGEGGEDPQRFQVVNDIDKDGKSQILPYLSGLKQGDTACSAIKQIASGRFGVTPEYLRSGQQLEIKIAQGAKPGEGGQLPGPKVDTYIAQLRNSKPGVALISPPPHHDIYSIEDLAQLIHDLHQVHPSAKVSVKLVAEIGIGTIAAGVAKANADVIQISGHDGGTGASPLSSIKHAGSPWELGLTEVHEALVANGLRDRVVLRADGGLKTGWDVIIAALLGAQEYGFGSIAMIAEGCIMARVCHTNNCPVGVATQKENLRKRFPGIPENVVNFFLFIAEEVRQIMSILGARKLDDIIGRVDLLEQRNIQLSKTKSIDLSCLLKSNQLTPDRTWISPKVQAHGNGPILEDKLLEDIEIVNAIKNHGKANRKIDIFNTDRSVCGRIAGEIASIHGNTSFSGELNFTFNGSAGQSFGTFLLKGMNIRLIGEANDYVGKGMNGGEITIIPPKQLEKSGDQVILGNTCLYGATGGELFALGRAGERFAVRNSGSNAVIEGAGDHCCEYMTGGVIIILGSTGRNVGAGMTGGVAFLLDTNNKVHELVNKEIVEVSNISNEVQERMLKNLLKKHLDKTSSKKALEILNQWEKWMKYFKIIVPPSERKNLGLS